ncbi:TrgA family protein [Oceanicola sp. 22II-s10i]|uniref:TrgA family protein n=1 Tax=Oceanicola sp. 22II-s10i TaxID=1317116 RepID=UPI001595DB1C|nr:TrgA family protein [Oceanicola sp. 22II-s10i]
MTRLVSAIMVAFLGWIVSGMVKVQVLEVYDTYNFGKFVGLTLLIGWMCGWFIIGGRANGRLGFGTAPAVGVSAVAMMVFWVLLLVSFNEMLRQAMERRFRGAMEAINEIPIIAIDYGQYLMTKEILLTLLIGAMVIGWLADLSARLWK